MKSSVNKPAFRIAFCSVIAALEVVLMLITGFVQIGTYALPCFAGMLTIAIVIEFNCKWAFGVFCTAAVLSFFLSPDKEAVVFFIALFGYYPILKNIIEQKINSKLISYLVKFAVFNAAAIGAFFVSMYILMVSPDEYTVFGVYIPYVFLIMGNVFFLVYDIAVGVYVRFYIQRLRKAIFRN